MYGGQKDEYDFHKTGFTAPWLAYLLSEAGFGDIRQVDRFEGIDRRDNSHAPLPFGRNVSLNMIATKGGASVPSELLQHDWTYRWFSRFDRLLEHTLNLSSQARSGVMERRRRRLEAYLRR